MNAINEKKGTFHMTVEEIVKTRRSIRKYKDTPVPKELIEQVLKAGMAAPSSKNRQPWKFLVVSGQAKDDALRTMEEGLKRERLDPLIPKSAPYIGGSEYTLKIMKEAPVVIFVVNPLAVQMGGDMSSDDRISEICNAQSVGAAIENMALTATELGLGSLWICDTFFAQRELDQWLGEAGELYAALALGYADEAPHARPRKVYSDVVVWRT